MTGAVAAALAAVLYGSAYVAIAIALDGFTPIGVAIWRGVIGTLVLGLLLLTPLVADQRPRALDLPAMARLAVLGVFGGGVFVLAMNGAVALSGATVTAFVAGLYAAAAALLAIPLLGERPEPGTLLALLAALAGTVLLSDLLMGEGSPLGIALALLAAVSFGLFLVLSRRWSARYGLSGATIGLASLSISALVAVTAAAITADPVGAAQPPAAALLALAWVAIGPGAVASVLVVIGMRRLSARFAGLMLLLNPPTAAVLARLLLEERLDLVQLAGAALILGAIAAATGTAPTRRAFRRSSRPGSAPPTCS